MLYRMTSRALLLARSLQIVRPIRPKVRYQTTHPQEPTENLNVGHSRFLAEGLKRTRWEGHPKVSGSGGLDGSAEDQDSLSEGKGKLSPTSSHLFKLILPLYRLHHNSEDTQNEPPMVFLLHPSQPLSHIARLVMSSLPPDSKSITFRSITPKGRIFRWSESTDLGDFIRDAARATEFELRVHSDNGEKVLQIEVPTFADRTRFLRRRLESVERELRSLEALKDRCDLEAHRGARKMAMGGLGMLVVYWGSVARLTFWDLGWDVMEPVTYLSGLSMVIIGYMWFLYQGREVSYSSVLHRSISTRRQALYKAHGFEIDRWADLIAEEKTLRKEIGKIAEDYDEDRWKETDAEREQKGAHASREVEELKSAAEKDDVSEESSSGQARTA